MTVWKRNGEWLELPLPSETWKPLKPGSVDEIAALLPVPRKYFLRLASQGRIRVQDNQVNLHVFANEEAAFRAERHDVDVLFEDDFCLVVNKPAGMSVHPSEAGQGGTLASAVAYYYESTGQACAVRHIHRLDQDTTGAVLYAKNEWAHVLLDEAMRDKRIDRRYVALAQGVFKRKQGTVDAPIGKDRHQSGKRRVTAGGDQAVTHYQVPRQLNHAALVELELETGRTHQIRVHLSHLGHPLVGDVLYGGSSRLFHRQALHGEKLTFEHPITQKLIEVHAPLPLDFQQLLDKVESTTKM
ncbi:RluA family pseudouridine synthase [Paenibacillus sp. CGMCC 1.16610]|uniref:Pseudouridine synthase n=1 Tax=Paenibacillus anseongense TaxID=2682845 RepID=A0ABW9U776_9BACL|nr:MULTISPECIES: RluA family pseudouridine synthase [Paenibacillus]MBA2939313.1 RluA family pseudouridine synthase [Paenibacillus sp. CGMCC 1.16610]MVQ35272.1 RluA family pseudouridine synthase [Paenibacillus anseongense]